MTKKIIFGNEARQMIKKGIDKCVDVVKVSMGGNGKNVLIFNGSSTEIINDGVSIAHSVEVKDRTEQAGIQLAKQCANQTNEDSGDGTTTTLVILQETLNQIITEFQTSKPRELRDKLFKEANEILNKVETKQINSYEDIYNLALTSSLDKDVAKLVADIYKELGKEAKISIEEKSDNVLEKEIVGGIKFGSKQADKFSEGKIELNDCPVFIADKINTIEDFKEAVIKALENDKESIVLVANTFSRPALVSIMAQTNINIVPVEYKMISPIDDIKVYVGDNCKKVIISKDETTLIGGNGDVEEKVKELKELLKNSDSQYDKDNLQNRLAGLQGKVAIIKVGKNTDVERQEAVLKIEDSLGAVKGAYELGYCKGGGMALLETSKEATKTMKSICGSPYRQIKINSGYSENEAMEIVEGVIDSFKTIKFSLLNALSTATSILTTEAALIEEEEEEYDN